MIVRSGWADCPTARTGSRSCRELRDEHSGTHVFRREGAGPDSIVGCCRGRRSTPHRRTRDHQDKGTHRIGSRTDSQRAAEPLSRPRADLFDYEPIKVMSRKDLLRISCAQGIAPPDWLGLRLLYEVAIRPIFFSRKDPFIAAVLKVRTTRLIERTAAELLGDGFCLEGAYVGKRVPRKDPRIAPKFELLGCVRSVEGSRLRLTDFRDGIEVVEASEVWPAKDVFSRLPVIRVQGGCTGDPCRPGVPAGRAEAGASTT